MFNFSDQQRKDFRDAKEGEFDSLPDGEYYATLSKVDCRQFGDNHEVKLMMIYEITDPKEHAEKKYCQFQSLENGKTFGILKGILRKFGYNPDKIELDDVFGIMKRQAGKHVKFTMKTNGKYQNMFFNEVETGQKEEKSEFDDDDFPL